MKKYLPERVIAEGFHESQVQAGSYREEAKANPLKRIITIFYM